MNDYSDNMTLRLEYPRFLDLPWNVSLRYWPGVCQQIEDMPRGLSRHSVVFVNYEGVIYAIKELPTEIAKQEYEFLLKMEELRLPAVTPVGYVRSVGEQAKNSALITRYLDRSLPYRLLFLHNSLIRYRKHLLDAIAGLMVQLHLAGIYWGDCSLSNTLFKRDAGALQAYLVDAETVAYYPKTFPSTLRYYDLEIMEENVNGDLLDIDTLEMLTDGVPIGDTGAYIRVRYQRLWDEITREDIINPGEHYRIQERIRALNNLGFSVGEIELATTDNGDQLRFKVVVTDRNYYCDQLKALTKVEAEEKQALQMMNEIQQLKATLSQTRNRSISISVAATYWLENIYLPTINHLQSLTDRHTDLPELYCQVLEHKWYLSEKAHRDVGHSAATNDFLTHFSQLQLK